MNEVNAIDDLLADQNEILDEDGALKEMPLITANALKKMRRSGTGPKFASIGNKIRYRRGDIMEFYDKWIKSSFTQTKTAPRAGRKGGKATVKTPYVAAPKVGKKSDTLA